MQRNNKFMHLINTMLKIKKYEKEPVSQFYNFFMLIKLW